MCVFLSNGTCVCIDVEHGVNTNSATILKTLMEAEELRLPPVALNVFALWMISPELGSSLNQNKFFFLYPLTVSIFMNYRSATETPSQAYQDLFRMGTTCKEVY